MCVCACARTCRGYDRNQGLSLFQDLEEQLDQKNRLIKKLVSQLKSFETSQKGFFFFCISAVSNLSYC